MQPFLTAFVIYRVKLYIIAYFFARFFSLGIVVSELIRIFAPPFVWEGLVNLWVPLTEFRRLAFLFLRDSTCINIFIINITMTKKCSHFWLHLSITGSNCISLPIFICLKTGAKIGLLFDLRKFFRPKSPKIPKSFCSKTPKIPKSFALKTSKYAKKAKRMTKT